MSPERPRRLGAAWTRKQRKPTAPKRRRAESSSSLERAFLTCWKRYGPDTEPVQEHRFAPPRRWRFDFAFPGARVAVELEGGVWTRGRHNRSGGFIADCEKYNAATLHGWKVLRFTEQDLRQRPLDVVEDVATLLLRGASAT